LLLRRDLAGASKVLAEVKRALDSGAAPAPALSVWWHRQSARLAVAKGDSKAAIQSYRSAITAQPHLTLLWEELAMVHTKQPCLVLSCAHSKVFNCCAAGV
jgi:hypothetical protein